MSSGSICIPPVAPCNEEPSLKSDLYTYIITYSFKAVMTHSLAAKHPFKVSGRHGGCSTSQDTKGCISGRRQHDQAAPGEDRRDTCFNRTALQSTYVTRSWPSAARFRCMLVAAMAGDSRDGWLYLSAADANANLWGRFVCSTLI